MNNDKILKELVDKLKDLETDEEILDCIDEEISGIMNPHKPRRKPKEEKESVIATSIDSNYEEAPEDWDNIDGVDFQNLLQSIAKLAELIGKSLPAHTSLYITRDYFEINEAHVEASLEDKK